jgi:hypothetical protein
MAAQAQSALTIAAIRANLTHHEASFFPPWGMMLSK